MKMPSITLSLIFLTLAYILPDPAHAQQPFWKQTNVTPLNLQNVLSFCSNASGSVLAATTDYGAANYQGSGVYRTTDNGNSWQYVGLFAAALASSGDTIYAAVGNKIYRSTNGSSSWIQRGTISGVSRGIENLLVAPNGDVFAAGVPDGIFISTNGGTSWNIVNNGLTNLNVQCLAIDSPNGYMFAGTDGGGVYRSTNHGQSWSGGGTVSIRSLALNNRGDIYAATQFGIYLSTDHGLTWQNAGLTNISVFSLAIDQAGCIYASSVLDGTIYVSVDSSQTWTNISKITSQATFRLFVNQIGVLFAGDVTLSVYGIYRSLDNGRSWSRQWLSDNRILSLTNTHNGELLAAAYGNYVFRTTDNGASWLQLRDGLTCSLVVSISTTANGYIFVGTDSSGVFRSSDNGQSWSNTSTGIGTNSHVFAFAIDSRGRLLAGCNPTAASSGGVYASSNNGDQWSVLTSTTGNVYSLISGPGGKIFAGTKDGKVYASTDTGATWTNSTLTSTTVRSLVITPGGSILSGTDYPGGLYQSTNNGITWSNIGFTTISVTSILVKSTSNMFLGTYGQGVYRSTNNGLSWAQVNDGLRENNVYSLASDAAGYLYAGTQSSGIFRSSQPVVTSTQYIVSSTPTEFQLSQNYPNPFNPSTTIQFSLPKSENVTLRIFNLLGEEVATLISENVQAGTHSVRWDATGATSGVYFYRLEAGEFTETKKLILVR